MYSMVLMAALTTGAGTPDCHFGGHGGHGGCHGCYGGWGCHGCHGGWGCHHGGWGGHGCYGCWGGCHGGYGCYGCYGGYGCYGCYGGWYGCSGCYSAWGCSGCYYGGDGVVGPGAVMPVAPVVPEGGAPGGGTLPAPNKEKDKKGSTSAEDNVRARLTVEVPEGATLFVDGQAVKSNSAQRKFVTPPLARGRSYFYELRAEVVRDGQPVSVSRRVIVRAGEEARASFPELQSTVTTATSQVDAK
jgi:uncharacterized protein (TIGR03000 family)